MKQSPFSVWMLGAVILAGSMTACHSAGQSTGTQAQTATQAQAGQVNAGQAGTQRSQAAHPANHSSQRSASTHTDTSGLNRVNVAQLPPQGQNTYRLILSGGPFPYARDGVVFQNREGTLPRRSRGSYHEYTVKTPGSSDRGARRIVCAALPECYYTGNHYASFSSIQP